MVGSIQLAFNSFVNAALICYLVPKCLNFDFVLRFGGTIQDIQVENSNDIL